jgi:hypothetical protein
MLRVLLLSSQISVLANAQVPVNNTLLNQCTANLINCANHTACDLDHNNTCMSTFSACFAQAETQLRSPLSCYQAAAAKNIFKYAWTIVLSIVSASVAIPAIAVLMKFIIKRYTCCHCLQKLVLADLSKQPDAEAGDDTPVNTIALIQSLSSISIAKAGVVFSGVVSFVSANWLFQLWQAQTTTDAACRFDTYGSLP